MQEAALILQNTNRKILDSYFYLAGYSNDVKKDKAAAISYLDKILEVDPTNPTALQYEKILKTPCKTASAKTENNKIVNDTLIH